MLKNNVERQNRFSIRKLTVGAASVLIGFAFMGMTSQTVKADDVSQKSEVAVKENVDTQLNKQNQPKAQILNVVNSGDESIRSRENNKIIPTNNTNGNKTDHKQILATIQNTANSNVNPKSSKEQPLATATANSTPQVVHKTASTIRTSIPVSASVLNPKDSLNQITIFKDGKPINFSYDLKTNDFLNGNQSLGDITVVFSDGKHDPKQVFFNTGVDVDKDVTDSVENINVKITFNKNSLPVKEGIFEAGYSIVTSVPIKVVGVKAKDNAKPIEIPKKEYYTDEQLGNYLSEEKLKGLLDFSDLTGLNKNCKVKNIILSDSEGEDSNFAVIDTNKAGLEDIILKVIYEDTDGVPFGDEYKENTFQYVKVKNGLKIVDKKAEHTVPKYRTTILTVNDTKNIQITPDFGNNTPEKGIKYNLIYDGFNVTNPDSTFATTSDFLSIDPKTGILTIDMVGLNSHHNYTFDNAANIELTYDDGTIKDIQAKIINIVGKKSVTDPNMRSDEVAQQSARDVINDYNNLDDDNPTYSWDESFDDTKAKQDTYVDVTMDGQTVKVPVEVILTNPKSAHPGRLVSVGLGNSVALDFHKTSDGSGASLISDDVVPKPSEIDIQGQEDKKVYLVYTYNASDNCYHLTKAVDRYFTASGKKAPESFSADKIKTIWVQKANTDVTNFKATDLDKKIEKHYGYTIPGQGTATSLASEQFDAANPMKNVAAIQKLGNGTSLSKTTIKVVSYDLLDLIGGTGDDITGNFIIYSFNNYYGATAKGGMTVPHNATTNLKPEDFVDISDLTPEHNSEIAKNSDGSLDIVWADDDGTPDEDAAIFGGDNIGDTEKGTVRINFKDGSHLDVPISAKIVKSMADNYINKIHTKEIDIPVGTPKDNIKVLDGIKNIDGIENKDISKYIDGDNSYFDFDEAPIDTSKPTIGEVPTYGAIIQFKDGSSLAMNDDGSKYFVRIPIKVVGVKETAQIKYVDAKDKQTEVKDDTPGDSLSGVTGQKLTIDKDQLTVPAGYKLNDTLNGDYTYTFSDGKNQVKTIYVDKLIKHNPGDKNIDPKEKDSDMFRDVTRTIIVKNPQTGKDNKTTQIVHLQRTKTVNNTTNKVDSYGQWTFKDKMQTWPEFDVPEFIDYTANAVDDSGNKVDLSSKKIAATNFDPSIEKNIPADTTITISYSKVHHDSTPTTSTTTRIDPTDEKDPNQHDLFKTVTRTITATNPDGTTTSQKQTQTFKRYKIVYVDSGQVLSYGDWTPESAVLAEVDIPQVDGYTSLIDGQKGQVLFASEVTPASGDITVNVSYQENKEKEEQHQNEIPTVINHHKKADQIVDTPTHVQILAARDAGKYYVLVNGKWILVPRIYSKNTEVTVNGSNQLRALNRKFNSRLPQTDASDRLAAYLGLGISLAAISLGFTSRKKRRN